MNKIIKLSGYDEVMSCDTEDNSKGKVYHIVFYNGKEFFCFRTRKTAIAFLKARSSRKKILIYATNLEYDIGNVFTHNFDDLKMFWASRLIRANSYGIVWFDTLNQWMISVAEMGKFLGIPKLPFNPKSLRYCKVDTKITYDFVYEMNKRYKQEGLTLCSTLPQTALKKWKDDFWKKPLYKIPPPVCNILSQAYYGGRVECFYLGKILNPHYADFKSSYPSVMSKETYPYPFTYYANQCNIYLHGVSHVKVRSNLKIPILPYRRDKLLTFPNGEFSGWWCNAELRYFVECGGEILDVYDGIVYPYTCFPFKEYIETFYNLRMKTKDDFLNYTFKKLMNALYGKFAQGSSESSQIVSIETFRRSYEYKVKQFKVINDKAVLFTISERTYPFFSNYIWPIYVTAYGRIKLHKALMQILKSKGKPLYCDTDSILWTGKKNISGINFGKQLGALYYEGKYNSANIKGNKFYKLGSKYFVKGVPKRIGIDNKNHQSIFFRTGKTTYKKPLRIKEGLRRNLPVNYWIDYTKHDKATYDKRARGRQKNSFTKPLVISE